MTIPNVILGYVNNVLRILQKHPKKIFRKSNFKAINTMNVKIVINSRYQRHLIYSMNARNVIRFDSVSRNVLSAIKNIVYHAKSPRFREIRLAL